MTETHAVETRQVGRALGGRHHVIGRHRQVEVRQVDFRQAGALRFEHGQRFTDGIARCFVESLVEMLPHDADPQAFERPAQARQVIRHRVVDRGRVAFVETGHHAEQKCSILGRSGDDARLVQAGSEGDHAVARHAAVGRFQAGRARQRRGLPDRAPGIGARRRRHDPCGHRRGRAARGAAGRTREVPGVLHRAEIAGLVRRAHREFVHVRLAEHHGAGSGKALDDGRVVRRDEILEHPRAAGRQHAAGAEDVLVHQRQSIKNPVFPFATERVRPLRRLNCSVRGNGYEGIEFLFVRVNPVQQRRHQLDSREITVLEALRELRQAMRMEVFAAHSMTFGTR